MPEADSIGVHRRKCVPAAWGPLYIPDEQQLSTADWCEQNVYLSTRIPTSAPGAWRRSNIPALCAKGGPLEALDDVTVETVTVMKGSQTALTTSAYCWLAHEQCSDPASALIVMNSTTDARDKASETWRPLWEDSKDLQPYLPTNRRREWTKLYQLINGSPIYWIGANSPGRLGAKPIRRLILDETDKYPQGFGRSRRGTQALSSSETGAAALARQRTKAFRKNSLAKILQISTPTDEHGEICVEHAQGDKRVLHVDCPYCGADQVMEWKHWKIDMEMAKVKPSDAINGCHYQCPHCKHAWSDQDRWTALAAGEWRPSVSPRDPKHRSYHLPSWCSTFVTTRYLATQWIKAQGNIHALQDFINSECAEPFQHFDNSIKDSQFAALEGDYSEEEMWVACPTYKDTLPEEPEPVVFGGVDVQKGWLAVIFRQFVLGGDSGLVWAGDAHDFRAVDKLAAKFDAQFVLMDQRYRTREVQEWAYAHSGYIPTMGVTRRTRRLFAVQSLNLDEGKSSGVGRMIETLDFDANMLKDIMAGLIHKIDGAPRWMIPRNYGANKDYTKQMSAERSVNGIWTNPGNKANHYWDAELLCLLAAIRFGYYGRYDDDGESEGEHDGEH